jgi:hypothetical protein
MANKTFIGEEIFEFKPMGMAMPTDDPDNPGGSRPKPTPKPPMADPDPSPAPGGPTGPGGAPEQPEEDSNAGLPSEAPEKSNTWTYLAIGLLALYFLRKK